MAKERFQFRVSSSLKSIVGRDLITNDFVAVFELVKNSIDAGASRIDLVFDLEEVEPAIWIVDNGKGMSYEDLKAKWLFLGYSAKKEGLEDEYQRTYAGNKGVGRFSCDRLGKTLEMQCRSKSCSEINLLRIDWEDYEADSTKEFAAIDVFYDSAKKFVIPKGLKGRKTGVAIKISGLRELESWNRKKLCKLKRSLAKLQNPFGGENEGTEIIIHCSRELEEDGQANEESLMVNGLVKNDILDVLDQKSTKITARITEDSKLETALYDRGELIYHISEPLDSDFKILRDSDLDASIYYLNLAAKNTFARRMGISSRDFGSLFLFRNGFQVFPVGEEGNDYWKLDRRKAQGYSRFLGNRDVMGRVDVSGEESKFRESSSRDKGLIETKEALALSRAVLWIIKRFERYVVGVNWKDRLDKNVDDTERLFLDQNRARIIELVGDLAGSEGIEIISYNRNLIGVLNKKSEQFEETLIPLRALVEKSGDKKLEKSLENAAKALLRIRKERQEALDYAERETEAREKAERQALESKEREDRATEALEEEKKRNRFLTLGGNRDINQLEDFIHHMIYDIGETKSAIENELELIGDKKGAQLASVRETLYRVKEGMDKIIVTSRYLTRANFRMISGEIKDDDLVGFMFDHLTVVTPDYNTKPVVNVEAADFEFNRTFKPIECGIMLDNMVSNSRKADASQITFNFSQQEGVLKIRVSDDGVGLARSVVEPKDIFERGFTRTDGSGIGLNFCKNLLESMGGAISVGNLEGQNGFILEIEIPKK